VAEELAVWLNDERVAVLGREGSRLRLTYTTEALERYELGTPLLSLSLPLTEPDYDAFAAAFEDFLGACGPALTG